MYHHDVTQQGILLERNFRFMIDVLGYIYVSTLQTSVIVYNYYNNSNQINMIIN
jgi:hypothetical protein